MVQSAPVYTTKDRLHAEILSRVFEWSWFIGLNLWIFGTNSDHFFITDFVILFLPIILLAVSDILDARHLQALNYIDKYI